MIGLLGSQTDAGIKVWLAGVRDLQKTASFVFMYSVFTPTKLADAYRTYTPQVMGKGGASGKGKEKLDECALQA